MGQKLVYFIHNICHKVNALGASNDRDVYIYIYINTYTAATGSF